MAQASRWSEVRQHFLHLADKSPSHRQDYLDLVCDGNVSLRSEIEALLRAHDDLDETVTDPQTDDPAVLDVQGTIGAYTVVERLGRGGAGTVYGAQHPDFGEVALKLLPAAHIADPMARARFEREAAVLKGLKHPALCAVYDVFVTPRIAAIALQRVRGVSLQQRLTEGPLTIGASLALIATLLDVLSLTHAAGIVHRDIKPANVMLDERGRARLIDFGIARVQGVKLTRTGQTLGSPRYMSPEQWRGDKVDARSDQFSLGVLWYELLVGKPAFNADRLADIAQQILHEEPPALPHCSIDGRRLDPVVPVLQKILKKDPAQRYGRIDEVAHVLGHVQNAYSTPTSK